MKYTVVITGASGGLGRHIAWQIAQSRPDITLLLMGRNRERLQNTLDSLPRASGHSILVVDQLDKINFSQLHFSNPLVGVVACAGITQENHYGPHDSWNEIIGTNLTGTYALVNELLPFLKQDLPCHKNVILISSLLANRGVKNYAAYCASKAGLLGLMRAWAAEWAENRILVNAICPGWVQTERVEAIIRNHAASRNIGEAAAAKELAGESLLQKMASPKEVADLVAFLLAPTQTSITGQALAINNGVWGC